MCRWICLFMAAGFMSAPFMAFGAGTGEMEAEFRCGTDLVELREESFEVLKKCGPPQSKEAITAVGESAWEKWVYGPSGGYYHVLTFMDGVLVRIREVPNE